MLRRGVVGSLGSFRVIIRSCATAYPIPCDTAPSITSAELATKPFDDTILAALNRPLSSDIIEIKPDGIIYLPEIRYRRILNAAFGQGGWAMLPRGAPLLRSNYVFREYAMYCRGVFVSQAVGEQTISYGMSESTAIEAAKSTALMRCCKDLGIASELWDPAFIQQWKENHTEKVWCVNEKSGEKRMLWRRKDRSFIQYPWTEQGVVKTRPQATSQTVVNQPKVTPAFTQATPPPPPPSSGQTTTRSPPEFTPPPSAPQGQTQTPESQSSPTKVFSPETVNVDLSEVAPDSITQGSDYAGLTWGAIVDNKDGRNFLSRACGNPHLDMNSRAVITDVLRRYLITKRQQ